MGTIRVEAVPVQSYFLGLFRFDHLQLVYQDETDPIDSQDYWFVIEGIQDGPLLSATLGASGENGTTSLAVANGASREALVDLIGTPEDRGSRIILSDPNAITTWNRMAAYAGAIEDQRYPYIPAALPFSATPTINSTSLITSVLWSVGIDLNNLLPFTLRLSPGPETILGTPDADSLAANSSFTTIASGPGNDTLTGSTNGFWLEKLYGGDGDDIFNWSFGQNIHHGGQPRSAYINDGLDTIDYTGVGAVHIEVTPYAVEHKVADFVSVFDGGSDQWFSIEQIFWNRESDIVTAGPGVDVLERPLGLDLKGQSGGRGDQLGLSDTKAPLLINVAGSQYMSVQSQANEGLDAGYWVKSVEWIVGSGGDDLIYMGPALLGADGFDGDDLIDARLSAAFSGQSPDGFDIEIDGGKGDDTIVSGEGRTFARGGEGADRFVLSAMTSGDGLVEFVIDDADASDKLYVPFDFFQLSRGDYEDSELFQMSGGVFQITDLFTPSYFFWGPPDDNEVEGNIMFVGSISYELEGSDLIITLMQGHADTETIDNGPGEPPGPEITSVVIETETETKIRINDWSDGVLGISFPITYSDEDFANAGSLGDYPGFESAVAAATGSDKFIAPLDERPESHLPKELGSGEAIAARALAPPNTDGTQDDDVIIADTGGPYQIYGRAGDDNLTGSDGGDLIDGGTGVDRMTGGRGNDVYIIDNAGDVIIETSRGGFDKVYSSIDYMLGDYVEHLTLTGTAVRATGNALRNTLTGNGLDNILDGGAGDDTLAGNGGDDTLTGGEGSDGYVYELGDGRDTIIETGTGATDKDVIVLAGALQPSDITFLRNPDQANNLILQFSDGGSLTIKDYFASTSPPIEGIVFTSGGTWTSAELQAAAAAAIVTQNIAPIARDDHFVYSRGMSVTIPVTALLDNDSDANGDALSVAGLFNIRGGTAMLDGLGNVVVTRASGHDGPVAFDYTISDGHGGASRAAFEIAMPQTAVANEAPQIIGTAIKKAREDKIATGKITATDADGDSLVYGIKAGSGPTMGAVTINADGTFVYTPNANVNGPEYFTVTVSDGQHAAVEKQLSFTIAAVNDKPVAVADGGFSIKAGQTLKIANSALLRNDSDIDGDTLMISSVSAAKGGTVSRNTDGTVSFKANAAGDASFKYTVSDGEGGTATATVSIKVLPAAPKTITGTNRADVLKSTEADEIFIGKAGNDTFVFKGVTGHDQINDFQPGLSHWCKGDVLDLRGKGFTSYSDLWDSIHKLGYDTVIDFDDGGSVRLKNVNPHSLHYDNFKIC